MTDTLRARLARPPILIAPGVYDPLTALIALGHHEELALHLRAAVRNGLTHDEIKEILLQSAIYCGVPAANAAFRVASQVFDEVGGE